MAWEIEYTDEFEAWWMKELDHAERESVAAYVALLVGGAKKGDDRWYEVNVPLAEKLYASHLEQLMEEGLIDGKEVS